MNPQYNNAAFLFLDFQNDVCSKGGKMVSQEPEVLDKFQHAINNTSAFLSKLRKNRIENIVHVQHVYKPGYPELSTDSLSPMENYVVSNKAFIEGEPGTEIVDDLKPLEHEYHIKKHTLSPFASTELGWWLNKRKIKTLYLSGVVTHYVILATALSAYDTGYTVVILQDCCMSGTEETHATALEILMPLGLVVNSTEITI